MPLGTEVGPDHAVLDGGQGTLEMRGWEVFHLTWWTETYEDTQRDMLIIVANSKWQQWQRMYKILILWDTPVNYDKTDRQIKLILE